ncbi:MAG TPA: DeoR/GlpR transcriptional regulator [Candidatus Coproplasma excrementigallinarum]|uniref:DeoR/GlpR transcriptional regulator n=1 Tax=Candidatus Coproplasma excrementigallinarum TaxID=2840747 RepID=A0A9D1MIR8_9FIRM|nr:DeoR/GlpR transcriptional regulator [Candidatus Coproplasma excrementigallinarum]
MLTNERYKKIAEYLKEKQSAKVKELAEYLFVSPATVRRDLVDMQKLGMLERSHGGAIYVENSNEVSIFIRLEKNAKEKELTASVALEHLPDFQTVFIDNSSTCLALAERMNLTHKTIITNGLQIATKLSQKKDVTLFMPGGEVHFNTNSVTGSITCNMLQRIKIDLMLSSCAAISNKAAFEQSLDTAIIKRTAFEQSKLRYLIADRTKFSLEAPYQTMPLASYDAVISNLGDSDAQELNAQGINIINK